MDWIQKCGRQKPTLKQHKTKDDLSQKEYTFIQVNLFITLISLF